MAQLQSLSDRVRAIENKIPMLEAKDAVLRDEFSQADTALRNADSSILDRITKLEQMSESLRLGQIERDLRDIQGTQIAILEVNKEILEEVVRRHNVAAILFTCVTLDPTKWEKGIKAMQLKSNQQAVASLSAVDAEGNPAPLNFDAPPVWTSDTPGTVTVEASPDGMTAVIGSPNPGPLGSAVVTLDAMAGGKALQATLAVDIIAGDAVAIQITTAEPTDV